MLLLAYKSLNQQGPAYLRNLLEYRKQSRSLRSSDDSRLREPLYKKEHFGARSFQCAAPRLWNALPDHLKQEQPGADESKKLLNFKKSLKTYLFANYYYHSG